MTQQELVLILADALLIVHVCFVAFVVCGLLLVYLGKVFGWHWVRNRRFRLLHLAAIAFVVIQTWLGMVCPLTTLEMALRAEVGAATYAGSFIQHWLHRILYYRAPEWVFISAYTVFGVLVLLSWFAVPPKAGK